MLGESAPWVHALVVPVGAHVHPSAPAAGARRCARCSTITAVTPPPPSTDMAQLCCSNAQCRVVLMYPRGAGAVQCSVCGNISDASQANQLGHIVCGGCHITLAFAYGAQSVKCAVCNFVTPVPAAGAGAALQAQPQQAAAQQQQPQAALAQQAQQQQPSKTVVVENPTGDGEVGRAACREEPPIGTVLPTLLVNAILSCPTVGVQSQNVAIGVKRD